MLVLYTVDLGLILGTLAVLLAFSVPQLNSLLKYGKTLNRISKFQWLYVPKRWFIHFYYLHSALALLSFCWNVVTVSSNTAFYLVLYINLIQSVRRLYECLYITKWSSSAKMHLSHYLAGLYFYSAINIIPFILGSKGAVASQSNYICLIILALFTLLSWDQYNNHCHLASLKKYTLPTYGLFQYVVCAHYFDEVLIYGLLFALCPSWSYLCIFVWVSVNLATSANMSWNWYRQKELMPQNAPVKRIIPFVL